MSCSNKRCRRRAVIRHNGANLCRGCYYKAISRGKIKSELDEPGVLK